MRTSRFSEQQIAFILKQADDGLSVEDVERLQKMLDTQLQGGKGNAVLFEGETPEGLEEFDNLFKAQNTPEAEGKGVLEEWCTGQ